MTELEKDLRLGLARIFEHDPHFVMLTGLFSVKDHNNRMVYEFVVAGEDKVRNRMGLSQKEFLRVMVPLLAREFEEHHHLKPAFLMEWLIDQSARQQGVRALVDELTRQIVAESEVQTESPNDWLDMDYIFRTLSWKAPPE